MADIEAFKSIVKRTLDALPRLQDEAIESGDYSKVDQAHSVLDRLNNISRDIVGQHDTGMEGPVGGEGEAGPAALMGPVPTPAEQIAGRPAVKSEDRYIPGDVDPSAVPSMLAPVNVNTPQPMAPATPTPTLLQPQDPRQAEKDKAKAAMDTLQQANSAIEAYIKSHEAQAAKNASQAAAAGGMAMPFNPYEKQDQKFRDYAQKNDFNKIASDLRVISSSTVQQPGLVEKAFGGSAKTIPGDAEAAKILPLIESAAKAQDLLDEMRKSGGVLALTREEVMPRQPVLLAEKRRLEEKISKAGDLEVPSLLQKKSEIEKNLQNIQEFDVKNPPAPAVEPAGPGLLQGEPGEEEAKAGTTPMPPTAETPAEPPVDYELQREAFEPPTLETIAPAAKTAYKNDPEAALKDAKKVVEQAAPDYVAEFHKRVMTELGEAPKPNFLTMIGIILGGLAGNTTALKIWSDKVNAYQMGKQKIGSEVFSEAKQAKSLESQEKRQAARDEAAHKRAMERDEAASGRLDKQLGFGREKLEETKRVNNIKLNLQKRQQDINALYNQARSASAQQKTLLMPLHDELNALTRKQNDLAKMASSFAMPQGQWASQAAAIDAQIQDVLGRMAQVMQK